MRAASDSSAEILREADCKLAMDRIIFAIRATGGERLSARLERISKGVYGMRQFTTADTENTEEAQRLKHSSLRAPSVFLCVCGGESSLMNERGACHAGFSEDPSLQA